MGFKAIPSAIAILIALIIWFIIPVPAGVTPQAWHLLAMFIGVKMLVMDIYHIPVGFSLGVVAAIIGTSVVASLRHTRRRSA